MTVGDAAEVAAEQEQEERPVEHCCDRCAESQPPEADRPHEDDVESRVDEHRGDADGDRDPVLPQRVERWRDDADDRVTHQPDRVELQRRGC